MSYAGSQGGDLQQAGHDGSYSYYLDMEGGVTELAAGSINIPWLAGIIISQGNGMTEAIARNSVIYCDIESGIEVSGMGSGGGYQGMGGVSGGLCVAW